MAARKRKGIGGRSFTAKKPGSTTTRKVKRGPNKGDTVTFRANSSSAREPGKPKPRRLVKDVGPRNTSKLPKGKHHKKR